VPSTHVPHNWRHWLLDRGSLTERLLVKSRGQLRVQLLKQQLERPRLSECRDLALPGRRLALVREVILHGNHRPWVYARSILPLSTLTGRLRSLRRLDNRPLGQLLFNDPTMVRGPFQIACLTPGNCEFPPEAGPVNQPLWGRRSIFRLDQKPVLVSEIFLPCFDPTAFSPYNGPDPSPDLRLHRIR